MIQYLTILKNKNVLKTLFAIEYLLFSYMHNWIQINSVTAPFLFEILSDDTKYRNE
jgi:NADH:ubiquinone oxidoreductase subunit K